MCDRDPGAIGLRRWLYGVCSLSIFRLDFPPGGARLYPLAKLPADPAVGGAAISVLAIRIWRSARLAPAVS